MQLSSTSSNASTAVSVAAPSQRQVGSYSALATSPTMQTDVLEILKQLERSVNIFFERRDIKHDNRRLLHLLQQHYNDASNMLARLYESSTDFITDSRIRVYAATLQSNAEAIAEQQKLLDNPKRLKIPFKRVRRTKDVLQKCEVDVKEFFDFLSSQGADTLRTGDSVDSAKYNPRSNVPHNPPRLTLDYNSTRCEGQLKAAVLDERGDMVVAVVASGQGGVGKTCALRGLATDIDIKKRFPGGILYIQLGHESSIQTIIQRIRGAVVCTGGGKNLVRKLAKMNNLSDAVAEACLWFEDQSCLFLIDDIWRVNDIDSDVFTIMRGMLNSESRLVYTSRDKRFLDGTDRLIEFNVNEAKGALSRRMLMTHAGFDLNDELVGKNKNAFETILGLCQGLPLALGITGASVLRISGMKRPNEKQNAWSDFRHDIMSGKTDILEKPVKEYGTLPRIVDTSLRVLQSQNAASKYSKWFRALCVLRKKQSVPLQTLQRLWDLKSLDDAEEVACTLFDVSVVQIWRETNGICMELHDLVLDIAIRQASENKETQKFYQTLVRNYIPFSGLIDEQCAAGGFTELPGRKRSLFKQGKRAKLLRFRPDRITEDVEESTEETCEQHIEFEAWWDTKDDGYLHDNLCRLLLHAGYRDELLGLLSKPQWIVKRLTKGGIYQVEQDIDHGKEAIHVRGSAEADMAYHLDMVAKAARMGWSAVSENPYEAWFRLYGHLVRYAQRCLRTRKFIYDIERCAPRPWAKPSIGFLPPAEGAEIELIKSSGEIESLYVSEEHLCFVWKSEYRVGVTQYNRKVGLPKTQELVPCTKEDSMEEDSTEEDSSTGHRKAEERQFCFAVNATGSRVVSGHDETVQVWDGQSGEAVGELLVGHTDWVTCVGVSADGSRVVSGSRDETVRIWDGCRRQAIGDALVGHTGWVTCVAMSTDGSRVVSGSRDETVRIWDGCSRQAIGDALVGHTDWVTCVAMSADGSRVVSGSDDKTVRIWDGCSGQAIGDALVGHTDWVTCVAMSADGSRVVSGSDDKTVRIWDGHSGKAVGDALIGHTNFVRCVAVNEDGSRVVSGSSDETVRIWDGLTGEAVGDALVGHTDVVYCAAVSRDGSRIVSGSFDKNVRIWDGQTGEAVGDALIGHTGLVACVAVNDDGSRAVSGSNDKTVRIWDGRSGKAVGDALVGHTDIVSCVAVNDDGSRVVSGSNDKTVRIWDGYSGKAVGDALVGHTDNINCVVMNDDGSRVVSGSDDKTLRMWDGRSGQAVGNALVGHERPVICVTMSGNGKRVVSGSYDRTVRIWNVQSGALVTVLNHGVWPRRVAVDTNGWRVVSISRYGDSKLWVAAVCVITGSDAAIHQRLSGVSLSWSSPRLESDADVVERRHDGTLLRLATCDSRPDRVYRIDGTDIWFSRDFTSRCMIIRR